MMMGFLKCVVLCAILCESNSEKNKKPEVEQRLVVDQKNLNQAWPSESSSQRLYEDKINIQNWLDEVVKASQTGQDSCEQYQKEDLDILTQYEQEFSAWGSRDGRFASSSNWSNSDNFKLKQSKILRRHGNF